MIKKTLALTGLAAALAMTALPAVGQTLCGQRGNFITHLGKNHLEAPTSMGITSNGKVIEILTSEKGSWTIIVTAPDGTSCLVAAGEAWENIDRIAMEPAA